MSDKMTPISFKELLNQAIKEYKRENKETAWRQPFCVCSPGESTCILWRRGTPNFERDRSIPGNVI